MTSNPKALSSALNDTGNPTNDFFSASTGSLPLLVKMPDGERHQIDVPPNSSVRDLKAQIANISSVQDASGTGNQNLGWDLDFAGSTMNENQTLEHYNIPDAYGHAGGLLKTIQDGGYDDPGKKVEALDKAYVVVQGISRGERDMERLINSVFEDTNDVDGLGSPSAQPSLTSLRRSKRSRIPMLNLSQLHPIDSPLPINGSKPNLPSAPPTPSQLIRRLSTFRPDLYDPKAVDKTTAALNPPLPEHNASGGVTHSNMNVLPLPSIPQRSSVNALISEPLTAPKKDDAPSGVVPPVDPGGKTALGTAPSTEENQGSGELKRGGTWFADIMASFGNNTSNDANRDDSDGDDQDVDGDSEGDGELDTVSELGKTRNSVTGSTPAGESAKQNGQNSTPSVISGDSAQNSASTHSVSKIEVDDSGQVRKGEKSEISASHHTTKTETFTEHNKRKFHPTESTTNSVKSQGQVIGLEPEVSMGAPSEQVKVPRKRGRKRKNPHLSEEERKAQRQAQNRESAKLSRIRRKNMTMEYEKRVNTLEGENENLRDTVAALTDRLEMLQNLLTISVRKQTIPTGAIEQLASAQQGDGVAALVAGGEARALAPLGGPHLGPGINVENTLNTPGLNIGGPNPVGAYTGNIGGMMSGGNSQLQRTDMSSVRQHMPSTSDSMPNFDFNNL